MTSQRTGLISARMALAVLLVGACALSAAQQRQSRRATNGAGNRVPPSVAQTLSAEAKSTASATATTSTSTKTRGTTVTEPVHVGKLQPVDEAAAIREQMKGVQIVPDTDVQLGYLIGPAQAWYEFKKGVLSWRDPLPEETNFVAITVQDAADLRPITNSKVSISIVDSDDKSIVTTTSLDLIWAKEFFRYGANVTLPEETTSPVLRVKVEAPDFARSDKVLGTFFNTAVSHSWKDAIISGRTTNGSAQAEPEQVTFGNGRHAPAIPTPYPGSAGETTAAVSAVKHKNGRVVAPAPAVAPASRSQR